MTKFLDAENRSWEPEVNVVTIGRVRKALGINLLELLLPENTLKMVWLMRRMVSMVSTDQNSTEATERIIERLAKTKNNAEFLATLSREI